MYIVLLTIFCTALFISGIIAPFTLHAELHFDSATVDPDPWWRPFFWTNYSERGWVLRLGVLGFHVCVAFHYYDSRGWRK